MMAAGIPLRASASAQENMDARSKLMFVWQVSELQKHLLRTYINTTASDLTD